MMAEQLKRAAFVLLIGLVLVLFLAVMSDYASGSDYVVSRGTTIQSERSIGVLIAEAGLGVLNGRKSTDSISGKTFAAATDDRLDTRVSETTLWVDGRRQFGQTSFIAAWRLLGFLVWDASGRIDRVTVGQFRGRSVRIVDTVENGRVWVRVTVGPPLGDPRVRCAVLTLEANEHVRVQNESTLRSWPGANSTLVLLSCSAQIDLPCDGRREHVHARRVRWGCDRPTLSERIAEREAGPELDDRVDEFISAWRAAGLSGRGRFADSVVAEFLERTCK